MSTHTTERASYLDLKPKARQPQLVHFPIEGEKDPAAQAMARKSWEARRAKA